MKVKLVQSGPIHYVDDIVVDRFPFLLGRHPECDHQLYHPLVSRRHCQLTEADGRLVVRDLQSKNGTFVNGNRVTDAGVLCDGDEINLGCLIYRVCLSPSTN
ncbi:MAG: FHA domain-containing protein [Planctomycetes bacterium]|nr:FHA domain-containing protein [Planctomycetota bacterium]